MRVLVICFDNVGDVVFSSLVPMSIKSNFPNSKVDYLCKPYGEVVANLIPSVDNVLSIKPYWAKNKSDKGKFIDFLKLFLNLNKNNYDIVINVSKSWRPSLFSRLIRVKEVIGFKSKKNNLFLTKSVTGYSKNIPVMDSISSLLTLIDIEVIEPKYSLDIDFSRKLPEKYIVLHPFAGDISRCAPLKLWLKLAQSLKDKLKIVWFGTPKELQLLKDRLGKSVSDHYFSDTLSDNNFLDAIALLPNAELFIGHDSGPLHIAASCKVPVLGLFLPGEPNRTFPQGGGISDIIYKEEPSLLVYQEFQDKVFELLEVTGSK
ncbi:glycosyltransferase family 9 protein [Vibrio ishigakensis]|uniref:glycosyltransferase family 9 protein n=1 Tax=Vibrio ishigakensis TaxID=1481914 RepID=UPI0021C3FB52|nr:glycosyltransferase family 9 protein [Vibrio ishigakensis]